MLTLERAARAEIHGNLLLQVIQRLMERQLNFGFAVCPIEAVVHATVNLGPCKLTAHDRILDDARITDIALACGYDSPEAFARAFRKQAGQSPSAFRAAPEWAPWAPDHQALRALRSQHMPAQPHPQSVEIVERDAVPVAAIEHRGDPARLGDTLRTFIAWRRAHRLHPSVSATYNVVYDNPDEVAPEAFRMDVCAATREPIAPNAAGVTARTLAGGRYAVLRHTGSDDTLGQSVAWLYADWLPASGEALRDVPLLLQRVRFYPDVPEHEAITDILLPLK